VIGDVEAGKRMAQNALETMIADNEIKRLEMYIQSGRQLERVVALTMQGLFCPKGRK
jgi:hypothetical protein